MSSWGQCELLTLDRRRCTRPAVEVDPCGRPTCGRVHDESLELEKDPELEVRAVSPRTSEG